MNKLKELYKDFHDFPALIVTVILTGAMLAFFGYVFYLMDNARPQEQYSDDTTGATRQKNESVEQGIIKQEGDMPEEAMEEPEDEEVFVEGSLKILANAGRTDFEIWNDGVSAGEIKRGVRSQVSVFKKIGGSVYLGISNEGLGGYILFGGPQMVYKLDTKSNTVSKIFDKEAFVSDISSDGKNLVSVESFYVGDSIRNYLDVYNLDTYQSKSYQVSEDYETAGHAIFSKDGKRLVYEAAAGNPNNETFAMFVIDLDTGIQTQVGGNDSYGKAQIWVENN